MTPVLFGLAGATLSPREAAFFREVNPAGFILFGRNVETPDQLSRLTAALRECVGRQRLAILVDQEGGQVQRLGPPHWRKAPPMGLFGKLYEKDPVLALSALSANVALLGAELAAVGITVDCLPVLDVPAKDSDPIIGDRAFSGEPDAVAALGAAAIQGLAQAGVLPVLKHIPGHGRARADSHKALPVVEASLSELRQTDFAPFARLKNAPFAMTAHVAYTAIDRATPATFSNKVVSQAIRGDIGFTNILMSDDIGMKALTGPFRERAARTLAAGIDLVLHCSGAMEEMEGVMEGVRELPAATQSALEAALEMAEKGAALDARRFQAAWRAAEDAIKSLSA
jgi:beta-N-acetylhexosaminidase